MQQEISQPSDPQQQRRNPFLEMKILRIIIILVALIGVFMLFFYVKAPMLPKYSKNIRQYDGGQFTYDVYLNKIKLGKSVLTFHGKKNIGGKDVYHITFFTTLPAFEDFEDIYADKETFLPLKVSRLIKRVGGFTSKIQEEYDQNAFKVEIKQEGVLFSKQFTIQKEAPIHNAILLPFHYRTKPDFVKGERLKINLPVVDFDVLLKGEDVVTTSSGKYNTYVFTSIPNRFTFWLSNDEKRIPIKIEDHTMLGYSLVLK